MKTEYEEILTPEEQEHLEWSLEKFRCGTGMWMTGKDKDSPGMYCANDLLIDLKNHVAKEEKKTQETSDSEPHK